MREPGLVFTRGWGWVGRSGEGRDAAVKIEGKDGGRGAAGH